VTNIETKKSLAGKIIQKNSLTKNRARQKVAIHSFLMGFLQGV
jgi:predicted HTH domain antitoxin